MSELCVQRSIEDAKNNGDIDGMVTLCLGLSRVAMDMAAIDRVPRYTMDRRENNAEHSYQLALVAPALATKYFPELNPGLVSQFAIIHDLIEIETGDVATFGLSAEELAKKEAHERAAIERLIARLPEQTVVLVLKYEEQLQPEARFVRMVDKMLPIISDINGPGSEVMHDDYSVFTVAKLVDTQTNIQKRFESWFPEPSMAPLHLARRALADKFIESFEESPLQYQDELPMVAE